MRNNKIDRRVLRTRRALKDALMALILEKGYDTLTIEDITERADLGRTTFYLHYRDKEELLLESILEIINDLVAQTRASGEQPILLTFQHAANNADLYRIILRGEGVFKAIDRLRKIVAQTIEELLGEALQEKSAKDQVEVNLQIPMDVFVNYFAGSLLGMLTWWLEQGAPYSPEEMTGMFRMLFFQGANKVLGVDLV